MFRFLARLLIVRLLACAGVAAGAELTRFTWIVDGVTREALIAVPAKIPASGAPLVFAFHGHGGSSRQAARSLGLHEEWSEAIVVYPEGLPTKGQLTDAAGNRAGWQPTAGAEGDRDLKFFDTMLADLRRKYAVDERRIYATGHSNGGGFTYLLWAERGPVFAAFAPSSAVLAHGFEKFTPKPVLHLGGTSDPLVKWSWQQRMIDYDLKVNGGGPRREQLGYTEYPSSHGATTATLVHSGGHRYPPDAGKVIVKFFKTHTKS